LGIAETYCSGVVRRISGLGTEDGNEFPLLILPCLAQMMADGALEPGSGHYRILGVPLPLDGVVDHSQGRARAHVDGAHAIQEKRSLFLKHNFFLPF
jgi:hypothetical protein